MTAPGKLIVEADTATGASITRQGDHRFPGRNPATDTVDASVTITNNAPTSGEIAIGTITVTFTGTDDAGNQGTAAAQITVSHKHRHTGLWRRARLATRHWPKTEPDTRWETLFLSSIDRNSMANRMTRPDRTAAMTTMDRPMMKTVCSCWPVQSPLPRRPQINYTVEASQAGKLDA
ncbi:MAG: hypothetical protein R3C05_00670 [Pirellulaceae bacterium]